jgi:hypothetical protein
MNAFAGAAMAATVSAAAITPLIVRALRDLSMWALMVNLLSLGRRERRPRLD